jgi:hypothetical protein
MSHGRGKKSVKNAPSLKPRDEARRWVGWTRRVFEKGLSLIVAMVPSSSWLFSALTCLSTNLIRRSCQPESGSTAYVTPVAPQPARSVYRARLGPIHSRKLGARVLPALPIPAVYQVHFRFSEASFHGFSRPSAAISASQSARISA